MLESHFRIYHGKKMIDYHLFLDAFREPDDIAEDFGGDLVSDEYTAIVSNTAANAATSVSASAIASAGANTSPTSAKVKDISGSPESKVSGNSIIAQDINSVGAQNNAPFSGLRAAGEGNSLSFVVFVSIAFQQ